MTLALRRARRLVLASRAESLGLSLRSGTMDAWILDELDRCDVYDLRSLALPARPCVVDIGANVGIFGALVLERWPDARVTGFELDATNAAIAAVHLRGRARVVRAAIVGDRVPAGYVRDASNSGGHALADAGAALRPLPRTLTLGQALDAAGCDRADLVKMDIEGGEYDVLGRAARDGALDRVDRLVMEWHELAPGQSVAALAKLLGDVGFTIALRRQDDGTGILTAHR